MSRWGQDCVDRVDCSTCIADRGRWCVDENGHRISGPHKERWRAYNLRRRNEREIEKKHRATTARFERSEA